MVAYLDHLYSYFRYSVTDCGKNALTNQLVVRMPSGPLKRPPKITLSEKDASNGFAGQPYDDLREAASCFY